MNEEKKMEDMIQYFWDLNIDIVKILNSINCEIIFDKTINSNEDFYKKVNQLFNVFLLGYNYRKIIDEKK